MQTNEVQMSWVKDHCHGDIKPGDVVIATFQGQAHQSFAVLEDTGTGMFRVQRPDGSVSPMRPRTILSLAERVIRS